MNKFITAIMVILVAFVVGIVSAFEGRNNTNRAARRHAGNYTIGKAAMAFAKVLAIALLIFVGMCMPVNTKPILALTIAPLSSDELKKLAAGHSAALKAKDEDPDYRFVHRIIVCRGFRLTEVWVAEATSRYCEMPGFDKETFIMVPWSNLKLHRCPPVIFYKGEEYVLVYASQGGEKKGNAFYAKKEFAIANDLVGKEFRDRPDGTDELRRQMVKSELEWLEMPESSISDRLLKKETMAKIRQINKSISAIMQEYSEGNKKTGAVAASLLTSEQPVSKVQKRQKLWGTPSTAKGGNLLQNDFVCIEDIIVSPKCKKRLDLITGKIYDIENTEIKATDGLMFCGAAWALEHLGLLPGVYQIRDNNGDLKGILVVLPDEKLAKTIGKTLTTVWGEKLPYTGQIVCFKSVNKQWFEYKSTGEFCLKDHTIRLCRTTTHTSGKVHMCRQSFQALMWHATLEQIVSVASKTVASLKEAATEAGYKAICQGMVRETSHPIFDAITISRLFVRSVSKQIWNKIQHAQAGKLLVDGYEFIAAPCMNTVINALFGTNMPELKSGEIRVPINSGIKIGTEAVLVRMPYVNPLPTVVKVVGYTVNDCIEICIKDTTMLALDADFDGDHIQVITETGVVEAAKRAIAFCKECGIEDPLAFDDAKTPAAKKVSNICDFISRAKELSDVGAKTAPIFMIMALIPWDATPDTVVTIGKYNLTVRELLWKAMKQKVLVTSAADAPKRDGKTDLNDEVMKEIRKEWIPFSQFFDHPYEYVIDMTTHRMVKIGEEPDEEDGEDAPVSGKRIVTSAIADSAMMRLRNHIITEVTGKNQIFHNAVDVMAQYEYTAFTDDGEPITVGTHGWVYTPDYNAYQGIDYKLWKQPTGNAKLDKYIEIVLKFESYKDDEDICVDGVHFPGSQFREFVLGDMLDAAEYAENQTSCPCLDLSDNKYVGMTVGLLVHRALKAKMNFERKYNDDPRTKAVLREDVYAHARQVIKAVVYHALKIEITEEEANIMLFNQQAAYLFSEHANEASSADLAYFFGREEYRPIFAKMIADYDEAHKEDDK